MVLVGGCAPAPPPDVLMFPGSNRAPAGGPPAVLGHQQQGPTGYFGYYPPMQQHHHAYTPQPGDFNCNLQFTQFPDAAHSWQHNPAMYMPPPPHHTHPAYHPRSPHAYDDWQAPGGTTSPAPQSGPPPSSTSLSANQAGPHTPSPCTPSALSTGPSSPSYHQYYHRPGSVGHSDLGGDGVTGGTVSPLDSGGSSGGLVSGPGGMGDGEGGSPPGSILGLQRPHQARSPYGWMKKPSFQMQPNTDGGYLDLDGISIKGKTRTKDKYRVVYSDHQRLELEKEFHYSRYITIRRKSELATMLGLSERQVKIWFQNRRAKERKQMKKRDELIHKEKLESVQYHPSVTAVPPMPHMHHHPHMSSAAHLGVPPTKPIMMDIKPVIQGLD